MNPEGYPTSRARQRCEQCDLLGNGLLSGHWKEPDPWGRPDDDLLVLLAQSQPWRRRQLDPMRCLVYGSMALIVLAWALTLAWLGAKIVGL